MNIEELKKPLNAKVVMERKVGGYPVSYIAAWHAIDEANRIFGFDGWDRETVYNKEVSRQEAKIGKEKKDGWKVGYKCKVKITVRVKDADGKNETWVCREGTGHGSGSMTDLFDCIESAAKEAESDAMKRALMTFGNPFGLALYDKSQKNVADEVVEVKKKPVNETTVIAEKIKAELGACQTKEACQKLWDERTAEIALVELGSAKTSTWLKAQYGKRLKELV